MILINLDTNPLLFDIKAMTLEFSKKTCLKILLLSQTMKFMLFHIHEIKLLLNFHQNWLWSYSSSKQWNFPFSRFIKFTLEREIINLIFSQEYEFTFEKHFYSMFMPHSPHVVYKIIKLFITLQSHIKQTTFVDQDSKFLGLFSCTFIEYLYNMLICWSHVVFLTSCSM